MRGQRQVKILPKSGPALPSEARLRAADAKLVDVKRQFTAAALGLLRGDYDKVTRVETALRSVDEVREILARILDAEIDEAKAFELGK